MPEAAQLSGKTIVITRAPGQAQEFADRLRAAGATIVQAPTIDIAPPDSYDSLDAVIDAIESYDFVIFTSTNGVNAFCDRLLERGRDMRALHETKVAAVGETTAAELRRRGITPDIVPNKFQSTALLPLLGGDQHGVRIAIVRAAKGRTELIDELRKRGATVDLAIAYQTVPAASQKETLETLIADGAISMITFTSPSTVENFFSLLSNDEKETVIRTIALAAIGPTTSEALRLHGAPVALQPEKSTMESFCDAIVGYFARNR